MLFQFRSLASLAVLCMMAESEAGSTGLVDTSAPPAPEGAPEGATPEAAPGCSEPNKKRVIFPALASAGGVFRSTPDAAGSVHFTMNETPVVPAFPVMKDAEGKVIPYPWEGHNRSSYLALTASCFDTEQGYHFYRAWELHSRYAEVVAEYTDAKNGVKKSGVATGVKKAATAMEYLQSLSADADAETLASLEKVLAMVRARSGQALQTEAAAETTAAA